MPFGTLRRLLGGPANPPGSRGQQTRQEILARAAKIAAQEGLGAVTIGRLAEALGMSKSGLFAHLSLPKSPFLLKRLNLQSRGV